MKLFSSALLDELSAKATASPRGRANHNIHMAADDPVQRFFVVANRQSYFRPHRHRTKSELAFVVRGGFDVLTFDESGRMLARYVVDAGGGASRVTKPRARPGTRSSRAPTAPHFSKSKRGRTIRRRRRSSLIGRPPRATRACRNSSSCCESLNPERSCAINRRRCPRAPEAGPPSYSRSGTMASTVDFLFLAHDFQFDLFARLIGGQYSRGVRAARRRAAIDR